MCLCVKHLDEIAATWYRGVTSRHPDLQRARTHIAIESKAIERRDITIQQLPSI